MTTAKRTIVAEKRRLLFTTALGATMAPLLIASLAYACTALATLSLSSSEGLAGSTVTGTGKNFVPHGADRPSNEPVVVRFNSRTATPLWSGRPDASGNISFSFVVPKAEAGQYTIIATQNDANGQPASGTPARASFRVNAPPPEPEPAGAAPAAEPDAATPAPAAAPASGPSQTPAPAPAPASSATPASSPRSAVARATRPAPAPAAAAPLVPAPANALEGLPSAPDPAPAVVSPAEPTPATNPARRTAMVSMADDSSGSPALAIALVGIGLILALGASAVAVRGRRDREAPARARITETGPDKD